MNMSDLVRCKNCKHWTSGHCAVIGIGEGKLLPTDGDFGCVLAERRALQFDEPTEEQWARRVLPNARFTARLMPEPTEEQTAQVRHALDSLTGLTPDDIASQLVSATMDPNDPKRVVVTMPAHRVGPERGAADAIAGLMVPTPMVQGEPGSVVGARVHQEEFRRAAPKSWGGVMRSIDASLSWRNNRIGLRFNDEYSRAWAEEHAAELQECMDLFMREHGGKPILLDGDRAMNQTANAALRLAFPETPLQVEQWTS
jgi:hypothetical protein